MGFTADLKFGKKYEEECKKFLTYDTFEYAPNTNFKPYDFLVVNDGKTIKYEVKSDRLTYKTGNLVIEYMCNNKPSGITSTEADFYMYFVVKPDASYDCYRIPVCELKEQVDKGRKTNGGDGWRAKMSLVPITAFEKYRLFAE